MNKADLVDAISSEAKLSKADAERALNAAVGAIERSLKKDDRVVLVGFGSFVVTKRKARTGLNPQTRKEIKIAAKKVVKFKAGTELSKRLNK